MGLTSPLRQLSTLSLLVICALAFTLTACGDEEETSGSSGSTSASGEIDVPKKTIAYGEIAAVDEITNRNVSQMKAAAEALGWELKYTNAQGDVAKLTSALQANVNQGVDAMVVGSTDAAVIRPALNAAKQRGIPAIVIGGAVSEDDLYSAHYTEDEGKMSTLLTEKMVEDLGGKGEIGAMEISQLSSGILRKEARDAVLEGTDIQVVEAQDGDLADPVQGSKKIANAIISKQPDLDAMWIVYDYMMPPALEALKQRGNDTTSIYTWFAGPENVRLMLANDQVKALVENNFDHTSLTAMDQLAAHFKNDTDLDPDALTKCPLKYEVVTKENAPEPDTIMWPVAENIKPYLENWRAGKFGEGADCGEA